MLFETEHVEFKLELTDAIYKEIIAFPNTEGGTIYLGVNNDGDELGLQDVDDTYTRLTNGIRDAIQPDITMFIRYQLQENNVICIKVGQGSYKPYYLKGKGLKPSGVYVRQGASSVPASVEQIRRMIKETDGDIYENLRSLNQSLTFTEAEKAFARYQVPLTEEKYVALGIRSLEDDQYTNLALLLSDQCQHTVKVAVFADSDRTIFKDAKEFAGSVLKQMEDTYSYLNLCNRKLAVFKGLERIEKPDYPEEAVREGLLNALVHRDYGFSGSIIINVTDFCMEFISLGGLLSGLSSEDIRSGISLPRNRKLAEIFHRLNLIESYGTGIRRIFSLYKTCPVQPQIETTQGVFKLTLPNMNTTTAHDAVAKQPATAEQGTLTRTPQISLLLSYLEENEEISDEELQDLLHIKKTRAYLLTRELREHGLLDVIGRGTGKKYRLREHT